MGIFKKVAKKALVKKAEAKTTPIVKKPATAAVKKKSPTAQGALARILQQKLPQILQQRRQGGGPTGMPGQGQPRLAPSNLQLQSGTGMQRGPLPGQPGGGPPTPDPNMSVMQPRMYDLERQAQMQMQAVQPISGRMPGQGMPPPDFINGVRQPPPGAQGPGQWVQPPMPGMAPGMSQIQVMPDSQWQPDASIGQALTGPGRG